jgi:putative zinc finger protein
MSHVDDGTLHAYLDGELSPAEAQGIEAHLAQCPVCRGRLEEERALITRAGELLVLAAPPDRELPPFRVGDVKPPARLWWQVRLPVAWAATVVLALGLGTYFGREVEPVRQEPVGRRSRDAPVSSELAQRESRAQGRGATPASRPAPSAVPAPAARNEADDMARQGDARGARRKLSPAPSAVNQAPAPQAGAGFVSFADERAVLKGSAITADTARVLLGADPLVIPGAPIRAIYRANELGYSAVVIVEQALDSGTVIEVVNRRRAPLALDQVVVTGAVAARRDSVSRAERAPLGRAAAADSLAALSRDAASLRAFKTPAGRPRSGLVSDVRGPLSQDSLSALRRLLQPLRP